MTSLPLLSRQHLLIDADDTLWENNIHFEEAFEDFVTFLNHEHLTRTEIQSITDEIGIANRGTHGYGARAFARNLRDTFQRITGVPDDDPDLAAAEQLGLRILEQRFDVIDGVEDTLAALRPHHDLFLLTKGHDEEQRLKVERSGIDSYFDAVLITDEKDEHTYRSTVDTLDLEPSQTWMIGNSPRSDINPAIRAGLNAVFIPHSRTWHLEVEEFAIEGWDGRFIQLVTFRELTTIFASGS